MLSEFLSGYSFLVILKSFHSWHCPWHPLAFSSCSAEGMWHKRVNWNISPRRMLLLVQTCLIRKNLSDTCWYFLATVKLMMIIPEEVHLDGILDTQGFICLVSRVWVRNKSRGWVPGDEKGKGKEESYIKRAITCRSTWNHVFGPFELEPKVLISFFVLDMSWISVTCNQESWNGEIFCCVYLVGFLFTKEVMFFLIFLI